MLTSLARSELPHENIDKTKDWLLRMINTPQNGTTDFIITLKDGGQAIGKMGVWRAEEIGFLLGTANWRKGLAEEALRALLSFFFVHSSYDKITADTDPENKACLGLLKKVGFEVTGFEKNTFQIGENWVDSTYLTLRKEWWDSIERVSTT
jgi:ribosomal-protein-alanine N-acetyltransferase